MKAITTILFIIFLANYTYSQDIHEEVTFPLLKPPRFGPNGTHHFSPITGIQTTITHTYTSLVPTSVVGPPKLYVGFLYKFRITSFLATGIQLAWAEYAYNVKQDSSKIFPDSLIHKKEKASFNLMQGELYLRINVDPKRGNVLGKYVDFFAWTGYPISKRYHFVDVVGKETHETTVKNFQGIASSWQYGYGIRLGWNRFALFFQYRLTPIIQKSQDNSIDLPKFTVGLVGSLHRN